MVSKAAQVVAEKGTAKIAEASEHARTFTPE